jgi:GDPmannose 4,6-dehydratase
MEERLSNVLITGITGQDGRILAKMLVARGDTVYGMVRGQNNPKAQAVLDYVPEVNLRSGDITDLSSLVSLIAEIQPDQVYNLAAISFVKLSWDQPILTGQVTGLGALNVLEAVRIATQDCRVFQASSSEMFGKVHAVPQSEGTPFHPRSPYGVAKVYAHYAVQNYRESYGMHVSSAIAFNHESELRGREFVTRKITSSVARIKKGLQSEIVLGSLDPMRDWSHAEDVMAGAVLMLQQDEPDDYVLASGETHSIREFLDEAFMVAGITSEPGEWAPWVRQDEKFMRPAEVDLLIGDASKAREVLGWKPKVDFKSLVRRMVQHDLDLLD